MTNQNQNNAAQAANEKDDAQRVKGIGPAYPYTPNTASPTPLPKLRAPVADEWAAFEKWHVSDFGRRPVPFRQGDTARWEGWRGRAALASAPVAGEAQRPLGYVAVLHAPCSARYFSRITDQHQARICADQWAKQYADVTPGPWPTEAVAVYAAPQASADAELCAAFNEWLDKTDFIQKRIASGKLPVKYLGWHRADVMRDLIDQASAEPARPCSCPSGDGSLRHPCAVHPADRQQRAGGADVGRLLTAAKGMTKLYGHVWDRADGALVVFPENVARFDVAFDALRAAVGEVVDDATQPEQGERDEG
ncbi:Uncharacterised protein [Achromobacter sp. 2789STDY5608633]|uniref:Uncharacterized protein n=1 Tax=Achromobacter insuavis TaxID=1287735 RepID=A0A6J4ZI00_9BURK|nr:MULTISPECIES: hypothetical protein [Achromobacter]CAB3627918.1 hypothetical protein LMG26845_00512 [Achromobacter insuavis]CUJ58414.1 Uncharacterised protein [Achromobacter sp. 2789STDY5608633]